MSKKVFGLLVALVLFLGVPVLIYVLVSNKVTIGYNQNYKPDQPLPFSHEMHAGKHKIDCKFCHTGTEDSRHAAIPSLNICMNCHLTIPGQTESTPEKPSPISKLTEAYYSNEQIQWNKVHLLPDHVKFSHAAHIKADKQCNECHGPIETMPKVYQWSSLSMGFCVNCHRKPENNASTDCGTCHY